MLRVTFSRYRRFLSLSYCETELGRYPQSRQLSRREFLAAAAAAAVVRAQPAEIDRAALAGNALALAKKAGVSYADIRINAMIASSSAHASRRIQTLSSETSFGFGVRVLRGGALGLRRFQRLFGEDPGRHCGVYPRGRPAAGALHPPNARWHVLGGRRRNQAANQELPLHESAVRILGLVEALGQTQRVRRCFPTRAR